MTTSSNLNIEHLVSNPSSPEVPVNEAYDLIDSCVADQITKNFASDADLTLSTSGDAPQEWQYLSLKLTDTGVVLTTARNVIVPTNKKTYLVYNESAQSLTVKTSAGTGIAVAASGVKYLYCDGTNVVVVSGDVVGPASAVDRAVMVADGTTGKAVIGTLVYIDASGNVGLGTTTPTEKLDIDSDAMRLRTAKTPSSASDTGNAGDIAWDSNYIYVCVATNTWKRSAIATW